jgi:hypothetical protein
MAYSITSWKEPFGVNAPGTEDVWEESRCEDTTSSQLPWTGDRQGFPLVCHYYRKLPVVTGTELSVARLKELNLPDVSEAFENKLHRY